MGKFWLHFTSGYGAIWMALVLIAILTQSHIDTGEFGLYGFPIIAAVYAFIRIKLKTSSEIEFERLQMENSRLTDELNSKSNETEIK